VKISVKSVMFGEGLSFDFVLEKACLEGSLGSEKGWVRKEDEIIALDFLFPCSFHLSRFFISYNVCYICVCVKLSVWGQHCQPNVGGKTAIVDCVFFRVTGLTLIRRTTGRPALVRMIPISSLRA